MCEEGCSNHTIFSFVCHSLSLYLCLSLSVVSLSTSHSLYALTSHTAFLTAFACTFSASLILSWISSPLVQSHSRLLFLHGFLVGFLLQTLLFFVFVLLLPLLPLFQSFPPCLVRTYACHVLMLPSICKWCSCLLFEACPLQIPGYAVPLLSHLRPAYSFLTDLSSVRLHSMLSSHIPFSSGFILNKGLCSVFIAPAVHGCHSGLSA